MPACTLQIADDDAAAAHVLEAEEEEEAERGNRAEAQATVAAAVKAAAAAEVSRKPLSHPSPPPAPPAHPPLFPFKNAQVPRERMFFKALEPEGGASDVGLSIQHYADANGVDVAVIGSRGMGAVKRALLSLVGLGSVSDWCVNHMGCPVIVVRGGPPAREA